jgi:hypothetical protein
VEGLEASLRNAGEDLFGRLGRGFALENDDHGKAFEKGKQKARG